MKTIILMATMLLMFGAVNAQIAEVKEDGNTLKIYDDKGSYQTSFSKCSSCSVKNVSTNYILIKDGSTTKYYDFRGSYVRSN